LKGRDQKKRTPKDSDALAFEPSLDAESSSFFRNAHCAHAILRIIPKIPNRRHRKKRTCLSYCEFSAAANVERTEAKRWQENGWPAVLTFTDADLIPKPAISLLRIEGSSVSSLDCLKPACVNCLSALKREAPPPNFDTKLQISPSEKQGRWEARECPVLHLV
jgi:hypothetical protein